MVSDSDALPYEFDLWFDIKDRSTLLETYRRQRDELRQMEALMERYGIVFTDSELSADDIDTSSMMPRPR